MLQGNHLHVRGTYSSKAFPCFAGCSIGVVQTTFPLFKPLPRGLPVLFRFALYRCFTELLQAYYILSAFTLKSEPWAAQSESSSAWARACMILSLCMSPCISASLHETCCFAPLTPQHKTARESSQETSLKKHVHPRTHPRTYTGKRAYAHSPRPAPAGPP